MMVEVISISRPMAKKEHVCDLCLLTIEKGKKYEKSFQKHDGVFTWKNHIHCNELANRMRMWDWVDEGLTSDDFETEVTEAYFNETGNKGSVKECVEYLCKKHSIKIG